MVEVLIDILLVDGSTRTAKRKVPRGTSGNDIIGKILDLRAIMVEDEEMVVTDKIISFKNLRVI